MLDTSGNNTGSVINNQGKDNDFQLIVETFNNAAGLNHASPYDILWQSKDIGAGIILHGLYEFKTKFNKKEEQFSCNITGVSKLNILHFITLAGFRKRYLPKSNNYLLIRVKDSVMEEVTIDIIRVEAFLEIIRYGDIEIIIGEEKFNFSAELLQTIYLKNQDQIFNKNFLELLEEYDIPELRDTSDAAYFLFQNEIIKVTSTGLEKIPYRKLNLLNLCVWRSHILELGFIQHPQPESSEFAKFLTNVSGRETSRLNAFKSAIGYLLHNINGSHMGQAVICYDEKPTDTNNPQGGTGKGVFSQAIAHMRETAKIDGKHFKADDKHRFQTVKVTSQVVSIDDLNKSVPFDVFFSCLTDGWTIERKFQDTIRLKPENSPKMLFSMNTVMNRNGTSNLRRMFILEFSDYYSRKIVTGAEHPIEDEHGILFDRVNWISSDWDAFTTYMLHCVQFYLQYGLQPYELINVGKNALIQSTGEDFAGWAEEQNFQTETVYKTKELFEDFKARFYGDDSTYKQRSFTNNIKKYASSMGWEVEIKTDNVTKMSRFIFISRNNEITFSS